jgi:hypothetical protein
MRPSNPLRTGPGLRPIVLGAALLLAGCATVTPVFPPPSAGESTPEPGHFHALPGRDAARVARLRSAPPPPQPDIESGRQPAADLHRLAALGYLEIGEAHFAADDLSVHADAVAEGAAAGAERVLLYPPEPAPATAATAPAATWLALYFVKVKPPFGATFRDLGSGERSRLGVDGGVRIGSVIGGTPASEANLLHDDVLVAIDGQAIPDKAGFETLLRARLGKRVRVAVIRDGERLERIVRLGLLPSDATP